MDVKKAIKLYKQNMVFSDIMELCDLTNSQVYAIDYGVRNGKHEWKIEDVARKVNNGMKSVEIERLFN